METQVQKPQTYQRVFYAARQAIRRHVSGGNVLIISTLLALVIANIPAVNQYYFSFWQQEVRLQVGSFNLFSHGGHPMSLLSFINDALMAIFFFTIGLEIKREILVGQLASFRNALLPIVAAIGGMLLPVGIFMLLSGGTPYSGGAAIPMATDIAFSLGILAMLGSRVPLSLKIFLTTLAVVDDIGGILVIAIGYTAHVELWYLIGAAIVLGILCIGQHIRIKSKIFYLTLGGVVWFLFLNSGVHPTIAGVLVAFCIPAKPVFNPKGYIQTIRRAIGNFRAENDEALTRYSILSGQQMDWLKQIESASDKVISPLQELEDSLHPIVNYLIVPLFAFANAGIYLLDMTPGAAIEGVSLAIIISLVSGKFLGILSFSWLAVKLHLAPMPDHATWPMISGVALLGGIGFTVSLFIANLTFNPADELQSHLLNLSKLGIVIGSLTAGILGYLSLKLTTKPAARL
ncbi:MAG: Na+/H+ antiporter NhaA [Muribaculaceae bacterium]|nr:Na+/H+ antiporter NhaA [Muribaculaceae bacterium]